MWDFPSVLCEYILLALVNREAAFSLWQGKIKLGKKSKQRFRQKVGRVKEMLCSYRKKQMPDSYL